VILDPGFWILDAGFPKMLAKEIKKRVRKQASSIKDPGSRKGITLIEMIAVIVVVGLAIPVIMLSWQDLAFRSGRAEVIAQATFYAQELMEEIKSKRFDENDAPAWTNSANFGTEGTEDPNDADTFDDVDDFVGCTDTRVTNPASGYTRSVSVNYVTLDTNDTWQDCTPSTNCLDDTGDCTNCNHCCYKRINVEVHHRFGDSSVVTMVSGY